MRRLKKIERPRVPRGSIIARRATNPGKDPWVLLTDELESELGIGAKISIHLAVAEDTYLCDDGKYHIEVHDLETGRKTRPIAQVRCLSKGWKEKDASWPQRYSVTESNVLPKLLKHMKNPLYQHI